jgi:glutamyl-tRNA reductase
MHYLIVSFTYKNTNIETREKLAFNSEQKLHEAHKSLHEDVTINELIILSTCNRVEIICSVNEPQRASEAILNYLSNFSSIELDELEERADIYEDSGAIHHLFSVASSLDSLVIGETQIVGQIKNAFKYSYESGFCGQKLARAMHHTFRCAASVRSSTEISKSPISVSSVAVTKAKEIFGELKDKVAIVVGAGEMSELACKHLSTQGAKIIILNRNIDNAQKLADKLECEAKVDNFEKLHTYINSYDLLFSATGAPDAIITASMTRACKMDRHWFDIAVPRDIEDIDQEGLYIYAVDDLQNIVAQNVALREEQAKVAYSIVKQFTVDFFKWLQTLSVDPIIKELREKAKQASIKEVEKALAKGYIDEDIRKNVSKIIHNAFNTFLHTPTQKLKSIAEHPSSDTIVESLQYFFDLDEEKKPVNKYNCEYQLEKDI